MMAHQYQNGPELAPLPPQPHVQQLPPTQPDAWPVYAHHQAQYAQAPATPTGHSEGMTASHGAASATTSYGRLPSSSEHSPYYAAANTYYGAKVAGASAVPLSGAYGPRSRRAGDGTLCCGCTLIVFVLSVAVAILASAVIGLAAGMAVEASRANRAEDRLGNSANRTVAVAAPLPTVPTFAQLSNNCSLPRSATDGQTYTTQFFNKATFTMFCNADAPGGPLMSLFSADFNTCMDACAAYTASIPRLFGDAVSGNASTSRNATCLAVSFIPLWTTKEGAVTGKAPGNCYLKPGPQNRTSLKTPNIGTECHAAILTGL